MNVREVGQHWQTRTVAVCWTQCDWERMADSVPRPVPNALYPMVVF